MSSMLSSQRVFAVQSFYAVQLTMALKLRGFIKKTGLLTYLRPKKIH